MRNKNQDPAPKPQNPKTPYKVLIGKILSKVKMEF